jgi:hypothetical protein
VIDAPAVVADAFTVAALAVLLGVLLGAGAIMGR